MTSSLDMIRGRQVVQTLTNQSGGAIIAGDVVIVSAAADESFTTTTSAAYNSTRVGVALESIAAAATGRILLEGYAPLVNVSASATRGHYLFTHTVAKQATSSASYAAGAFGQILKAGTTPSAMIFPVAQVGSAGVGGTSGSTDNAVIRADGTGGATVQSSAATIDDSGSVNIPTGQTYNINNTPHTHASAGALVLLEQHAGAGASTPTLDFTTFISATYDEYLIEIVNLIPATNSVAFDMRMGTGAGPTFDTGNNYGYMNFTWRVAATATGGGDSGSDRIQLGYNNTIENTANFAVYGHLRLYNPGSAIYKTVEGAVNLLASSLRIGNLVDGIYRSTTAVTGVQFFFSSGDVASGTIRIYGIAKT